MLLYFFIRLEKIMWFSSKFPKRHFSYAYPSVSADSVWSIFAVLKIQCIYAQRFYCPSISLNLIDFSLLSKILQQKSHSFDDFDKKIQNIWGKFIFDKITIFLKAVSFNHLNFVFGSSFNFFRIDNYSTIFSYQIMSPIMMPKPNF